MPHLDRLAEVDWPSLHHAYGPARDVPDLLRALVDPEHAPEALRREAEQTCGDVHEQVEWVLWGNVIHQGTRWQVTRFVVPFLVEILCDGPDDERLRRFLVPYLHHLAMGNPTERFPSPMNPDEEFRDLEGLSAPSGAPDSGNEVLRALWARDSYLAVEDALDSIAPFALADDDETALETLALLASFPRRAAQTVPLVREIARTRRDQRAGHAVVTLAQLVGAEALEDAERLVHAEDRSVSLQAACAAVLADPDHASSEAITLLTTPFDDVASTTSAHAGSLKQLVGCCLARLPDEHRERAIDAIAHQHREASAMEKVSLSGNLLWLAFGDQAAPAVASALTPLQRRALETIREWGAFSLDRGEFVDYSALLRDRGLPHKKSTLGNWLEGHDPLARQKPRRPWWKFWGAVN